MITDQGIIEGNAYETLRFRARICPHASLFADVHVKHAVPMGTETLETAARDTVERGLADGLIISGIGTGLPTKAQEVERVRRACPQATILVGSGVTRENIREYLQFADAVIVGTSLKHGGRVDRPVDPRRVAALAKAMR
jgi:membrane complex biogenesis BtpA family protein